MEPAQIQVAVPLIVDIIQIGGDRLMRFIREGLPERALKQSAQNATDFSEKFARVEQSHREFFAASGRTLSDVETVVEDPDAAHALKLAMYSASRTDAPDLHHMLAEALAARFALPTGSEKAIILNRALEVLATLGPKQLNILGLMATIYAVRPPRDPNVEEMVRLLEPSYSDNRVAGNIEKRRAQTVVWDAFLADAHAYMEAKMVEIHAFDDIGPITTQDARYLASVGCLAYGTETFRDLPANMTRTSPGPYQHNGYGERDTNNFKTWDRGANYDALMDNWNSVLQHCALTPVGMVLGLIVHDKRMNTRHLLRWESEDIVINDVTKQVWDGEDLDRVMAEKIAKAVWSDRRFQENLHREIRDNQRR